MKIVTGKGHSNFEKRFTGVDLGRGLGDIPFLVYTSLRIVNFCHGVGIFFFKEADKIWTLWTFFSKVLTKKLNLQILFFEGC